MQAPSVLSCAFALTAFVSPAPGACDSDRARELVVCLSRGTASANAASPARAIASFATRVATLGLRVTRRLDEGLPQAGADALRTGDSGEPGTPGDPFDLDPSRVLLVEAADAEAARAAIAALAADPAVAWVEPNAVRTPAIEWRPTQGAADRVPAPAFSTLLSPSFPNDPLFQDSRQWGLRNLGPAGIYGGVAGADIHALGAWAISVGSNDVLLAVADTGIDPDQPDLAATLPDGSPRVTLAFNSTRGPDRSVRDTYGHGTPVAGVMAARTNDGVHFDSLGAAGVCGGDGADNFGCRIVPIKITQGNSGESSSFDIARAVFYATRVGCRALNLSFAGDEPSEIERKALRHAITHGCVVVTAIGNRGFVYGPRPQYPAAYAADGLCIAVGASDEWDRRAVFSSYGPGLDVVAPGIDIWTTFMTYPSLAGGWYLGYLSDAGTSFATPFVTGTVGLLAAARPDLDAGDFQSIVRLSADDVGEPGRDTETGWGRLNAEAALLRVRPDVALWHGETIVTGLRRVGIDTLNVEGAVPPAAERYRGRRALARFEVTATVAIPDSFAGPVDVWPRAKGTSTLPAGRPPAAWTSWSEVASRGERTATLRGYLYRVLDAGSDDAGAWLPVPPDQARLAFTVLGTVGHAPAAGATWLGPIVRPSPNPFRSATALWGPPHAPVEIFDLAGRRVRAVVLDGSGRAHWDGHGADGMPVGPGLYFLRLPRGPAARVVRLP